MSHRELLKIHALKATPKRLRLLEILEAASSPLTLADIQKKFTRVSVDTVTLYRNLETFVRAGIADEVRISGDPLPRFERAHGHHDHVVCDSCNKVADLPGCSGHALPSPVSHDFPVITSHIIEFRGLCASCSKKAAC